MMYGREKSDPVIVAEKPTNKAASAVAELVERRYGTRGERGAAKHSPGTAPDCECHRRCDAYGIP